MDPDKIKNKLIELSKQDKYVDGIFNYCDRWCEKCTKTDVCRNFALSSEMKISEDLSNEDFWKELSNIFKASILLIQENAHELKIDIEEISQEIEDIDFENTRHPVDVMAREHSLEVSRWLGDHYEMINLGIDKALKSEKNTTFGLKEAFEVIEWYNFFIASKIGRVFFSRSYMDDAADEYDSNGSAKIATIAIDRSIAAFSVFLTHFPSKEDDILDFLKTLSTLKIVINREFPDAKKFKRPGFDD